MSWLSSFWKHNRNFLGNAIKNVAPAAFLIPGVGPLAAAGIGGLGSALGRGIQEGGNFGNILKQGVQGAGQAYLGAKLTGGDGKSLQKLKGLFKGTQSGSPAAQTARQFTGAAPTVPGAGAGAAGPGGLPGVQFTPSSAAAITGPTAAALPGGSSGFSLGGALGGAAKWAQANPTAAAMGLQATGQLAALPAENRMKAAQQKQIELDNRLKEEDDARQRARDEALAPLWKLFEAQLRDSFTNPPRSKYATPSYS